MVLVRFFVAQVDDVMSQGEELAVCGEGERRASGALVSLLGLFF